MSPKKPESVKPVIPNKSEVVSTTYELPPTIKKKMAEIIATKIDAERALAQLEVNYLAQKSQLIDKLTDLYKQQQDQTADALKFGEKDMSKTWVFKEATMALHIKE